MNLSNLKETTIEEIENKSTKLSKDQYLLKVNGGCGFMVKLNKDGSVPKAFLDWREYYSKSQKIYIIQETFRSGWKFNGLRTGMSTAWIQLLHPFGFVLEINGRGFDGICKKISMDNGIITTPCRFLPSLKNAELEVKIE